MAIQNKSACCDCAVQIDPCTCSNPCGVECRSKEGFASKCGFNEFEDPSVPRRVYRKRVFGGTQDTTVFIEPTGCGTEAGHITNLWDVVCQYNKDTCVLTMDNNSTQNFFGSITPLPWDCANLPDGVTGPTSAETIFGDGHCIDFGYNDGINYHSIHRTGGTHDELSDEDTDQDAIDRANAAIGSWTGCTCSSCGAFITEEDVHEVFGYKAVQVRGNITGMTIGHSYDVRIHFSRRILGSGGPYIAFGIAEFTHVATAPSEPTVWVDVPNELDFETIATFCEVGPG